MPTDLNSLCDSDAGIVESTVYEADALARVEDMLERGVVDEQWLRPLATAIRNRRLRVPTLSTTISRVVDLLGNPEVNLDELSTLVVQDPGLSARLMGVANSSFFRGAAAVENVRDALMRMGIREARTIVLVLALRGVVLRSPGQGSSATPFWRHALLTAAAAQEISSENPDWQSLGFLAGLVHEIGQLVIQAFAAELPDWREDGEAPNASDVHKMVEGLHADLGAHVLSNWGFSGDFCDGVLMHHSLEMDSAEGKGAELARILDLSDRLAVLVEVGWPKDHEDLPESLVRAGEVLGYTEEGLFDLAIEAEASFDVLSKVS